MSFVFVQTSHNWADEFDMEGAHVYVTDEFNEKLETIRLAFEKGHINEHDEFYFGTNEALEFYDFNDFMGGVTVTECSEEFYNEFKRIAKWGVGIDVIDRLLDRANDPEHEEDEEDED